MQRLAPLALAALLLAAPAAAQQPTRGFTVEEIVGLLRSQVDSERVLFLVQQRCIHFAPEEPALKQIASAGGTLALLEGLRGPGVCSTAERKPTAPRAPAAPPPAPTPSPDATPIPEAKPRRDSHGYFSFGYTQTTFRPRGTAEDNTGRGGMVELGGGTRRLMGYLRVEIVDVDGAGDVSRGSYAGGVRLFVAPSRWGVRPYVDGGAQLTEISYFDDEGETVRTLLGWTGEAGGGVALRLGGRLWLDVAHRRRRGSFTRENWPDDNPPPGNQFTPLRGGGEVWTAGLTIGG